MANRTRILASLLVIAAACGDDGPSNNDGGGDGGGTCATAPLSIASVPGMVSGTVKGGGADLNAPEGSCTDEYGWYEPAGEDTVVAIHGLTPGMRYGLTLQSEDTADAFGDDLSLYITPNCPPATGMVTGCTTFTDEAVVFFTNDPEVIAFTATAATHYVVIDTGIDAADVGTGNFTLTVSPATCGPQTEETDCTGGTPYCREFGCRQCVSGFDCMSGTPSCDDNYTCVAGPAQCTGDDTRDDGAGDDGPSVASMLNAPTTTTAVTTTGAICNAPNTEQDWYKVTLASNVRISLEFTGASNDLDLFLLDSTGEVVDSATSNAGINEFILTADIAASATYYVVVTQYAPMNNVAAVPYTLKLEVPECDPSVWPLPACGTPAKPVCSANGTCVAGGSMMCTGDTAGEQADDGPAGGRTLTAGNLTGQICTEDDTEVDFYQFQVNAAGAGETINLAWSDTTDLDLYVFDSQGRLVGESFYGTMAETVTLTNLATGTYYAQVVAFVPQGGASSLAAITYTINGQATAVTSCSTGGRTCGTEYASQIYRGSCATNVCSFITGAGAVAQNAACDSNDDCMAGRCSYVRHESDAQKSVCGPMSCTADAMCTAVNPDLRCTTGFQTNFCQPSCTLDLQCGVNVSSPTLDVGQPWNYFTCNTTTNVCTAQ